MWSGRKKLVGDFVYLSPLLRQKAVDTIRNEEVGFSVDRGHSLGSSRTSMLAEVGGRMVGVGGDLLKKQIRSSRSQLFQNRTSSSATARFTSLSRRVVYHPNP